MSNAYKCDRCGGYFDAVRDSKNGGAKFFYRPFCEELHADNLGLAHDNERMTGTFDLCRSCAGRVLRFVKPEKPIFKDKDGGEYYEEGDEQLEDGDTGCGRHGGERDRG